MSLQGVIVLYNSERGFGFIKSASVDDDVFFHISNFDSEDLPEPGMRVIFDLNGDADKRKSASKIRILENYDPLLKRQVDNQRNESRSREEEKLVYTAEAIVREGSPKNEMYTGTLKLSGRRLQFDGESGFLFRKEKSISRPLRLVSSVSKEPLQGHVIKGGGPILFVSTPKFFGCRDLNRLMDALRKAI